MFSVTLHEYRQAIISAVWMVILSIIPPDLVRIGTLLLGGVICLCNVAHAMRPQVLMEKLRLRLLILEGKLRDTVDSGIIHLSDTNFKSPRQNSIQGLGASREDAFDVGGDSTRNKGSREGSLIRN